MAWTALLVAFGIIVLALVIMAVAFYNRFVTLENRCNEAWSNVDTELRRRHDLIPNLVASVKAYATHERQLMDDVTKARTRAVRALHDGGRLDRDESRLAGLVDRLLAVAEAYPDLKASQGFLDLQQELAITEDRIQAARRFYNGNVRDHRNATRQFPGTLFARLFQPPTMAFFEVEPVHVQAPQVGM